MADDLSLLFRLKGSYEGRPAFQNASADIARLRQAFGPQLTQTLTVANKSFSDIDGTLTNFVAQRVPLVGGAIVRVTEGIKGFGNESDKASKAASTVATSIQSIANQSGKSVPQITSFLSKYVQLETQSKRNEAAFKFFGGSIDAIGNKTAKFTPELEQAKTALTAIAAESGSASVAIGALAGPIALVVLEFIALAAGAALAAKEIFELTKKAADFQGKMFDLAQQTGLAVETLSALEVAALTTGGRLESITQAVVLFQRKLEEAQDPLSKTAELFRKFEIDTSDTETSLRSTFNALAQMPEGFAQTNAAAEFFGARGGKQVLAILKETNGDLDATIKRLREMGILISGDAARAADKFNDELALLELQLRALTAVFAEDLIPVIADAIRSFGDLVQAIRPLISVLGTVTTFALRPVAQGLKGLSLAVQVLTGDYKALARAIKEAREQQDIKPITVPSVSPVPLPEAPSARQAASDAATQAEAIVAATKRSVAVQNQALAELFQQGRRNREQEAEATIAANKRVLEAEKQSIDARLTLKEQEIKALDEAQQKRGEVVRRDTDDYRAITAEISKLQQERLDKENLFTVTSREIRARAAKERADSTRNQIQNETDLITSELDRQAKDIEAQIARGALAESDGLTIIEQLERAKIELRIESRERQRDVGFLTVQDQVDINAELQKLNQERDRLADEQRNRRLQREQDAAQREVEILTANIDTLIQLEQLAGERRIATITTLAQQRVIAEEEAARQILQIRLDLLDDEIEATRTKLKAAAAITDKDERIRTQAELNNQIRVLTEQRKTIQADGEREIEAGRQRDLDNERRYADELEKIKERVRDIERDAAEEVIRLMRLRFANRGDIIRAERDLELQEEADRHQRVTDSIRTQRQETDAEIRLFEARLARLKVGTTEEIEEHDRLIESLERLRQKRAELDRAQRAEDERSRTRTETITVKAEIEIANPDAALRDVFDSIGESVTDLASKFAELIGIGEEFSILSAQIAQQIGGAMAGAFDQFANALGQTVSNWVLLGETGPAVMRKILAQALASLAAEAAVNAIKELALGFATLFFNPAESASHFVAAGLWASIGGVAAIAGRGVAGDLFKPKTATTGSGGRGTSERSGETRPIDLTRTQQNQRLDIFLHTEPGRDFGRDVVRAIVDDVRSNGDAREVIIHTAKES